MESIENELLMKILNYIMKKKALISVLYGAYKCDIESLSYDEILEIFEKMGENTAGLMIKLEQGVNLKLIGHDGRSSLKARAYYLEEEAKILLESKLLEETMNIYIIETKKLEEKEKIRTRYII